MSMRWRRSMCGFQSTLPAKGSDWMRVLGPSVTVKFQSTLPAKGSDLRPWAEIGKTAVFQSTLPAKGSDLPLMDVGHVIPEISIHASREGKRRLLFSDHAGAGVISIHASREGKRQQATLLRANMERFQSTLPAKGSDTSHETALVTSANFNPRFPRREATRSARLHPLPASYFNPRFPRREATGSRAKMREMFAISIHASREGKRPGVGSRSLVARVHFNPRFPRREATTRTSYMAFSTVFQSTLPAKGSDRNILGLLFHSHYM